MARLPGRLAACVAFSLMLTTGAQASDIACHHGLGSQAARCDGQSAPGNTCRHADKPPSGAALICDYTMLRGAYERVYAEQLQGLRTGEFGPDDIAAWRRLRDACTSVPCLDRAFANWRDYARQKPIPAAADAPPGVPAQPARATRKSKPDAAGQKAEVRQPTPVGKPEPRVKQQERQQERQQEKQQEGQQEGQQEERHERQQRDTLPATAVASTESREQPAPVEKNRSLPDTVSPPAPQLPPEPVADRNIKALPIAPVTIDPPLPDSASVPAPQLRPEAATGRETPERPIASVAIHQPPRGPATLWTPAYPVDGTLPRRWETLVALAWLGLCGVCLAWWCRRRRIEWLPDAARRRERTRTAARIVLVSAGLIAVNSIVLFWILA